MGYLIIQFNLIQLTLFIILYLVRYLRDLGFVYKLMSDILYLMDLKLTPAIQNSFSVDTHLSLAL